MAALVLLAGIVASFVMGTPPRSVRGEPAARNFLDVWRRSREATYVVRSDFVRTLPDGNKLRSTTTTVQRPPDDRLVIGLGAVSGRVGGRIVRCAPASGPGGPCVIGDRAIDYGREVDNEIDGLASYVLGSRPLYQVVDFGQSGDRCFRLDLALGLPSPPYGDHALFCFDRDTGAPSLIEIRRPEAVDRTVARQIRTVVTDADVRIPDDRGPTVDVGGPGA